MRVGSASCWKETTAKQTFSDRGTTYCYYACFVFVAWCQASVDQYALKEVEWIVMVQLFSHARPSTNGCDCLSILQISLISNKAWLSLTMHIMSIARTTTVSTQSCKLCLRMSSHLPEVVNTSDSYVSITFTTDNKSSVAQQSILEEVLCYVSLLIVHQSMD